jgi:hypothetical protein
MAALTGLYGEPLDGTQLAVEDLVGVARTLQRAGDVDRAFEIASRAVEAGGGHESLRARADISKARGDRARALADFESLAAAVDDAGVRLELAKLYEHYVKEPQKALTIVELGTGEDELRSLRRTRRLTGKIDRALARPAQTKRASQTSQTPLPGMSHAGAPMQAPGTTAMKTPVEARAKSRAKAR